MLARRAGFTLLELCLALLIGTLLIFLAVPSVSGLFREQRLKRTFERFDQLVATAVNRSTSEQRVYALTAGKEGIRLAPLEDKSNHSTEETLALGDEETIELQFPAALAGRSEARWIFWGNGVCEPAIVSFHGAAGTWSAQYDPLTAHAQFLNSSVQ